MVLEYGLFWPTIFRDAYIFCKFVKKVKTFGTPRALISDQGTHFYKKVVYVLMKKYGSDRKDWSLQLNNVLWAYQTTYKGPIDM
ncbi:Retrovirus-related Pol polyprotein from transposon 412 family [Gossypium australe]|uniref:Retrovirus-related Pol polyprotein from transposon 412 family n=1 Tax=Gossypium australe TaxID=47621 RepID=A0A5B6W6S9_9ROSI|nr:Retrovirus-related Pol polyprotein from transposon 412 family [Gossypium australe]